VILSTVQEVDVFKKVKIKNFKGIVDLTLDLDRFNILIGANSSGKTTILQALDLLIGCVSRDVQEYLRDRKWTVSDIRSQLTKSRTISFEAIIELPLDEAVEAFLWCIDFQVVIKTNTILLESETLSRIDPVWFVNLGYEAAYKAENGNDNLLYHYTDGKVFYGTPLLNRHVDIQSDNLQFKLSSSVLKIFEFSDDDVVFGAINRLKAFLTNSNYFETLAAENMRVSSRGKTDNIGKGGKRLAAFIKQFNYDQRKHYLDTLNGILKNIRSIEAVTKGVPGWVELYVGESYLENQIKVKPSHISDGTLRIMALIALLQTVNNPGLIMLDEIENGLNPFITAKIAELLNTKSLETYQQMIFTTHSSLMLDDFKPDDIIYVYRSENGHINAKKIFHTKKLREYLEYMNPGEIWINSTEAELLGENDQL